MLLSVWRVLRFVIVQSELDGSLNGFCRLRLLHLRLWRVAVDLLVDAVQRGFGALIRRGLLDG